MSEPDADRSRRILDSLVVAVLELDERDAIAFANRGAAALIGRDDLVGTPLVDLVHEADRDAFETWLDAPTSTALDIRLHEDRWVALTRADRIISLVDVTERKHFERSLSDAVDRFAGFMDASSAIGWMKDASGAYVYVNQACATLHGLTCDDMLGRTDFDLVGRDHATAISQADARVLATGTPALTIEHADDRTWQMARFLFWDAAGARYTAGIALDITAQRAVEETLRLTQEQLLQSQKMDAVGRLAGGIAHDFNNLLTVILSYCSMVLDRESSTTTLSAVREIETAGQRAADLTRQLLALSRHEVIEPQVIDLAELVADTRKMLQRLLDEDVELVIEPSPSLGKIYADPGCVFQVVMNLAVNARDAMPGGGTLTFALADVIVDDALASRLSGAKAGPYVRLTVTDTGAGMDPATQRRIFEPFFTTKEPGKGTGLGLSTVFAILQQSGASIAVTSALGAGTSFAIYFPSTDRVASGDRAAPRVPLRTGAETILVVEDDLAVRSLAASVLRAQGYRVLVAGSPNEAIDISAKQPASSIELLLSDVVMPKMSGVDLWKLIAEQRPSMKVLWMSGYTDDGVHRRGLEATGTPLLRKPFTPYALASRVRSVLDR